MSVLEDEIEYPSGGFCPNKTDYCSFGCCGGSDSHHCSFPIGVFIGCGFGALGTICLLISLFRCRLRRKRNQAQMQNACAEPNFDQENNAYMSARRISILSGSVDILKCPSYEPPPSYETAIAGTEEITTRCENT